MPFTLEKYHRIIECLELEGALNITLFQMSCHGQGQHPPYQVTEIPTQPALKLYIR